MYVHPLTQWVSVFQCQYQHISCIACFCVTTEIEPTYFQSLHLRLTRTLCTFIYLTDVFLSFSRTFSSVWWHCGMASWVASSTREMLIVNECIGALCYQSSASKRRRSKNSCCINTSPYHISLECAFWLAFTKTDDNDYYQNDAFTPPTCSFLFALFFSSAPVLLFLIWTISPIVVLISNNTIFGIVLLKSRCATISKSSSPLCVLMTTTAGAPFGITCHLQQLTINLRSCWPSFVPVTPWRHSVGRTRPFAS